MGTLKNALTALFNANNYTPSTSGIASKKISVTETSGLPTGQIGMNDLASVLGALGSPITLTNSEDLDNIRDTGLYRWGSTGSGPANSPLTDGAGAAVVIKVNTITSIQVVFATSSSDTQYSGQPFMTVRVYSNGWRPWVNVGKVTT